jgi:hypothetical protein
MARFDVCLNPNPDSAPAVPYLLQVQLDLLEPVSTRVVVPLALLSERGQPARHLNPQFEIERSRPATPLSIPSIGNTHTRYIP